MKPDLIRRGVMQATDKERVTRNFDPARSKPLPHHRIIEKSGNKARIDVTIMSAAGAAIFSGRAAGRAAPHYPPNRPVSVATPRTCPVVAVTRSSMVNPGVSAGVVSSAYAVTV